MSNNNSPVNLFEYEELAKSLLPKDRYDYIAGGAGDELTLKRTRCVLDSIYLKPKALINVANRNLSTTVLGKPIKYPVMLDPSGDHARAHPEAEFATVRAAGDAGTIMVVSSSSTAKLEEISEAATGPVWYQQSFYRDEGFTIELARRAERAGYTAICVTIDNKVMGKRERNIRNHYVNPPSPNYEWSSSLVKDQAATWVNLEHLASKLDIPIVVKGIMNGIDSKLCFDYGAQAVIVSNHGARQLDSTLTTIEALPEIVSSAGKHLEVYLDGGIRRGIDIVKALALGARAVLIGRPIFWGLAANGEAGVSRVLHMLKDELDNTMVLCGIPNIESITMDFIGLKSPLSSILKLR